MLKRPSPERGKAWRSVYRDIRSRGVQMLRDLCFADADQRRGFRDLTGPPTGVSAPDRAGLRWFGLTRAQYEQDRAADDL